MKAELDVLRPSTEGERTKASEREIGTIVADMWSNAESLLRAELELGLAEIDVRVEKLKHTMLIATIGGAALYAGILAMLAAAVLGLSEVMAPWLAALLVGALMAGIGATVTMRSGDRVVAAEKSKKHSLPSARAMKEASK